MSLPDGTVVISKDQPDPRWGMQAAMLKEIALTTPGGRKMTLTRERHVKLDDSTNPLSLSALTDTVTLNGRQHIINYDVKGRQATLRTPQGRQVIASMDKKGRPVKAETPGLAPVSFTYDDRGRLKAVVQGTGEAERVTGLGYDDRGRIAGITDPLRRTVRLEYEDEGRVVKQFLPGGREVVARFDAVGNLASLKPPGRPAHAFAYTPASQLQSYQPPAAGGDKDTGYIYNRDGQPSQVRLADGGVIDLAYDKVGHLETISFPGGRVRIDWDAKKEQVGSLTTADGQTRAYTYDGPLPTSIIIGGAVRGEIVQKFDDNLDLVSLTINGGDPVEYSYDEDGLLTKAGLLTLTPDAGNGLQRGTQIGSVTTRKDYNEFGELNRFTALYAGKEMFAVRYECDQLGRVVKLTETIGDEATTYAYGYDAADRLTDVNKNGEQVAHYEYDPNGNRLAYDGPRVARRGRYDDQDRLLQYGDATWTHTPSGYWESKTAGDKATRYRYDAVGNLRGSSCRRAHGLITSSTP